MANGLLSVAEAERLVLHHAPRWPVECIPLSQATGRILRQPVNADRDYPPIHRSTMDGIAVAHSSWLSGRRTWLIEHIVTAGSPAPSLSDPAAGCVRIMTGAALPSNCDSIVPVEMVTFNGDRAAIASDYNVTAGQYVHARGVDLVQGSCALEEGAILDAPRIAIAAALGYAEVEVAVWPSVTVISTGNEVVSIETVNPRPGQTRASNLIALTSGLHSMGFHAITALHVPDELEQTTCAIREAIERDDLVLISGGVSMGMLDVVPHALSACGVRPIFHKVAQKPGKPLWFGSTDRCHVFGLPGNPVSTLTTFRRYVAPFLLSALGARPASTELRALHAPVKPHHELTTFPPGPDPRPVPCITPRPHPPSRVGRFPFVGRQRGFRRNSSRRKIARRRPRRPVLSLVTT
jgi:molybdopterin molybdotransferase